MALIKCPDCGKEFSDQAAACPNCGRPNEKAKPAAEKKTGCAAWGCLVVIVFIVIAIAQGAGNMSSDPLASSPTPAPVAYQPPKLELESWTWSDEYGYATAEGRVKNISSEPLSNVEAVVTYSTKAGTFITSDDAIIEFNPILPGQTSPFKVITTYNPAMSTASVDFKELMGGSIEWRRRAGKK